MNFPDFLVSISDKDRNKEINECPSAEPMPIWFFHLTSFFSHVPDNHHENPNRAKYDYRFPLKYQFETDGTTPQPFITSPSHPSPDNSKIEIWTDGSYDKNTNHTMGSASIDIFKLNRLDTIFRTIQAKVPHGYQPLVGKKYTAFTLHSSTATTPTRLPST
jgi:hypothetical protein